MAPTRFAALLMVAAWAIPGPALAGHLATPVVVPMDNVTLVSFKKPVSIVYVGNPSIADVTMMDAHHAFVLGKKFGETNLLALDANKTIVANEPVTVAHRTAGSVTIFRGSDTFNYSCTESHCEAGPIPGDPKVFVDNMEAAATERDDEANKAASGSGGQSTH